MPTFPLVLNETFRRGLSQDHAGETFLQLFDNAQEHDHLLSVKLMEVSHEPNAMIAVVDAVEAAAAATTAAFIAANAGQDATQIADAEVMRTDALLAFDKPSDLTWLIGEFYILHTWADVVEGWIEEARGEGDIPLEGAVQRPLLSVDPTAFRAQAKAFIAPVRQLLQRQRPSKGVVTFDQEGTLVVPVFGYKTTQDLSIFLAKTLAPMDGRRRAGSIVKLRRGVQRRTVSRRTA